MASTFWIGTNVKVTNGSATVEVTSGDVITKVKASAMFVASNFSLPYEVERTYTTGGKDYIVLKENWQGASGTGLSAVAVTSPAGIEEARQTLLSLISTYESFANSVKPTVEGNAVVQRTSAGRIKTANAVSSDEAVAYGQLGSAATKDVGTSAGNVMEVGAFGFGGISPAQSPNGDLNDIERTGVYDVDGATLNTPPAFNPKNGMCLHLSRTDTLATQLLYSRRTTQMFMRVNEGSGWENWAEFYHSGNSVNPLDYGIGIHRHNDGSPTEMKNVSADALAGGLYTGYEGLNNNATLGDNPFTDSGAAYGLLNITGVDPDPTKYIFQLAGQYSGYRLRWRAATVSGFSTWRDVYHSGNTNFNEFGGNGNECIATGEIVTSTIARFYLPINAKTKPVSLSIIGSFNVFRLSGSVVSGAGTGSFALSAISSPKMAVIDVTGSGLTLGEVVNLRCAVNNAKITVNF
ncbi:tail fiber [Alteromonas phage vB_AemP_PT15-A5]|nr:tail fiber [Alteromonas phage vB_AemP_PT15-A5]